MGYEEPCRRADHNLGVWSRYVRSWSGSLFRARVPVEVKVEHQQHRDATLAAGTVVEAVGRAYDNGGIWAIDLLHVRSGPLNGECVTAPAGPDEEPPFGFDPVGAAGLTNRP